MLHEYEISAALWRKWCRKPKRGDLGSIAGVTYLPVDYGGQAQIWERWDAGSILALIKGQDEWEAIK